MQSTTSSSVPPAIEEERPSIIAALQLQDFLFLICLLLLVGFMTTQKQSKKLEVQKAELSTQLAAAQAALAVKVPGDTSAQALRQEVERLRGQVAAVTAERDNARIAFTKPNVAQGHDQPPVIRLAETAGFRFAPNSAALSPEYESGIRKEIVPKVLDAHRKYGTLVVEVRGHTDEVPLGSCSKSNMDAFLLKVLWRERVPALTFCSNVELAMARAAVVAAVLRESLPANFVVIALSAGQTVTEFGVLSTGTRDTGPNLARRRIEITTTKQQ